MYIIQVVCISAVALIVGADDEIKEDMCLPPVSVIIPLTDIVEAAHTFLYLLPLDDETITYTPEDPAAQYGLLFSLIYEMLHYFYDITFYYDDKEYYKYYDEALDKAKNLSRNPHRVGQLFQRMCMDFEQGVEYLEGMIDSKCAKENRKKTCHYSLLEAFNDHPDLHIYADLLVSVGDLAQAYLKNTYEIFANTREMENFLIYSKDEIKPLFDKVFEVIVHNFMALPKLN